METKKVSNIKFQSLEKPDLVRVSNQFQFHFLNIVENPELLDVSIITYRIIFKILADLRNKNFNLDTKGNNLTQLRLFDTEFKTLDNTYAKFTYKISELDKHRNNKSIEEALAFLTDYKKEWYSHKNCNGITIKSYGGLISDPSYTKGSVTFYISAYWLEKLILMHNYNVVIYTVIDYIREPKKLLFYLWILSLDDEGTGVNYLTFISKFRLNHTSYNNLYKDFLFPLRKKLNQISDTSFNMRFDGKKIYFTKQKLLPLDDNITLKEKTIDKLKIKKKAHYLKLRHKLNNEDYNFIKKALEDKEIFLKIEKDYEDFVQNNRNQKIKSNLIIGNNFMDYFKKWIIN